MNVRFHATLRQAVGGRHVEAEWRDGLTVWGFVTEMVERYPALGAQLLDSEGKLARHVHVMVNGRDAPYLEQGLDTLLRATDSIDVFPGGRRRRVSEVVRDRELRGIPRWLLRGYLEQLGGVVVGPSPQPAPLGEGAFPDSRFRGDGEWARQHRRVDGR